MQTRGFLIALLVSSLGFIACNDTRPGGDAGTDVRTDTSPGSDVTVDTMADTAADTMADTTTNDVIAPDAPGPMDVLSDDSATSDVPAPEDVMLSCMNVGDSCGDSTACINEGHDCYGSGTGGLCAPSRPPCGGFVMAGCPNAPANECVRLLGTDYGVCVTAEEKACLCNSSARSMLQTGDDGCPATP